MGADAEISNSILFLVSWIFLILSFVIQVTGKSLESLVIPTGTIEEDKKRLKKAMQSYTKSKEKPYVLVTGGISRGENGKPLKDDGNYFIYKELRDHYNLKPTDFIIEGKSEDTLENFLYSIKKVKGKGINNMKIVTNQTQYWRFKLFEKEAKKEGLIDDDFKISPIYTSESPKEFIYGALAYIKDYFRIKSSGSLEKAKDKKISGVGSFLKEIFTPK